MKNTQTLINGINTNLLSTNDRGLQYGDGLFETIKCLDRKLVFWSQHYQRLHSSAEKLDIVCPSEQTFIDDIVALLDEDTSDNSNNVIKIILTRGNSERGYACQSGNQPNRIVKFSTFDSADINEGITVTFCKYALSANKQLAGIKHLNRLDNVIARNSIGKSYQEGIMLNQHGDVIEGTMSNIFLVKNNRLSTPAITDCGVDGIIRQQIIQLTQSGQSPAHIETLSKTDVLEADEVFFCNSLIGIWPVKYVDETEYFSQTMSNHLAQQLKQAERNHAISL